MWNALRQCFKNAKKKRKNKKKCETLKIQKARGRQIRSVFSNEVTDNEGEKIFNPK